MSCTSIDELHAEIAAVTLPRANQRGGPAACAAPAGSRSDKKPHHPHCAPKSLDLKPHRYAIVATVQRPDGVASRARQDTVAKIGYSSSIRWDASIG